MDFALAEHPLLNSLIVSQMFEFLQNSNHITAKNVNNLRYVCKTWFSLSLPIFRSVATLRLGPDNCDNHSKALFPITKFLQLFQNPENDPYEFQRLPFKNYLISGVTITDYNMLKGIDDPQNFWNTIGPLVSQLTFENCVFPGNDTQPFKRILNEKLPNLQKLHLLNNKTNDNSTEEEEEDCYEDELERIPQNRHLKYLEVDGDTPMNSLTLLINSSNLETLRVRDIINSYTLRHNNGNYCIENLIIVWELFERFRNTFGGLPECKLKTLDVMHSNFFVGIRLPLRRMGSCRFPLETVTLDLKPNSGYNNRRFNPNMNADITNVLLPLFEFYADTLKVLKVYRPPVFAESRNNLFRWAMPKLEELHVWGNLLQNFEFLRNLPKLKVLMINPYCYDKAGVMQTEFYPENNVRQLRVFSRRYNPFKGNMLAGMSLIEREQIRLECMEELHLELRFMTDTVIQVLATWMPNLKKIRANLHSAEEFQAVCKWMPNLEELGILHNSQLNNEIVTGINANGGDRNIYNVTKLKKLKRFYQQLPTCNYEGVLSDQSVHEGFLQMESLEWISVPVSQEMSKEAEMALKEHVSHVCFIRDYESPHVGDGFCCKRKSFLEDIACVANKKKDN